ncbi:DUF559 domain-containing protein [Bradyrhizobium neotropicale]|uniref:DUF559 domain-containing protein n=1 Tax=Bradyrhizobium neotropicale TaxID=1497615 RepID=UPI0026C4AD3C
MPGQDEKSIRLARRLRIDQTDAETVLWNRIRNRRIDGNKFVGQEPIIGYICDFVCRENASSSKSMAASTMNRPRMRSEMNV